ncbi:hypothetical protein S245_058912, partial [Arachis hypogaea]
LKHSERDFFADSVALAEEIWKVSELECLEASIKAAFEAIRSRGTNSHVVLSHYVEDLKANAEYIGYTVASNVIQWFWEVVKTFNKKDMARFLQFVTGTSKVPLEGFKALQGISGPQRFQIHKAYGAPDRLPSAHT